MSDTSTMEGDLPVEYYTEAGRLESFQVAHPLPMRRDSSTKGRGVKPAKWPHSWLEPKSLAEAGFIYMPEPGNLDNVMCFLCRRSICGWTNGDEPLSEHLKLSPDCGWAITSCIEAKVGDIHLENPMSTRMIEARKATFGDRWPHDEKKGWKCKTKQLVEAGWIYKPTYDGDDFAECIYCTLALDGWEPADKPFHEHHARSPECAFFELCNAPEGPIAKITTTKRKPRTSAVKSSSRLSMQSTLKPELSYLEDAPSFATANETLLDEGDSIPATISIMPKGKGKKATTAKGRKKKIESVAADSDHEMNAPSDHESAPPPPSKAAKGKKGKKVKEEAPPPPAHHHSVHSAVSETLVVEADIPKSRRGKKRGSDPELDESIIAPAPKRRTRNSVAAQNEMSLMPTESSMNHTNDEISSSTPPKKAAAPKRKPVRAPLSRKVSEASNAPSTGDEHLDQQLEDELDRQLDDMDVENPSRTVSPEMLNPKPAMPPLGRRLRNSGGKEMESSHHDMFQQMDVDEDEVDRDMKRLEEEEISKPLPKGKGKKAVPAAAPQERKVSVSVKQQVKEEKARRKVAEEQARREQAERDVEELRLRQEAEAEELRLRQEEEEAEELRLQEEAEELRMQQKAEEHRLQQISEEKRRVAAQAEAEAAERKRQSEVRAEQARLEDERRQAEEEAEAHRLELEAEAEERRLELEAEAEEEEERRLVAEEEQRLKLEAEAEDEEEERLRLKAEEAAVQEKLVQKNEAAAAARANKASAAAKAKSKGKAKVKPKSPSPEPEPSPARSPTPARSPAPVDSSAHSPSVDQQSTPVQPHSAVSARSENRSAISTRSQRTVRTLSPSASPQSSDAENHPPSSRPSSSVQPSSAMTAKQVLGVTTPKTPSRSLDRPGATTKQGLHSEQPWEEVDLDTIFAHMGSSPNKENEGDSGVSMIQGVKGGDLNEDERNMTVEEWIRFNAVKAEERLKRECEALVGVFEREGIRAVKCLEGVETIDG